MKIALGVTGGISAYKAAELVREFQQRGLDVQVILTAHGQEFIRPLTFAALTGQKVITGMFGSGQQEANVESAIEHIAVAQSIDLLVIAPATANCLGKLANGVALIVLVTAEFVGAQTGVGVMIFQSWQVFAIERLFVGLVVVSFLGYLLSLIFDELERMAIPWRRMY